jgi:hypothetical protein
MKKVAVGVIQFETGPCKLVRAILKLKMGLANL